MLPRDTRKRHAYYDTISWRVMVGEFLWDAPSLRVKQGWGVGARFIATLSGGQVIGVGPPPNHPQGWRAFCGHPISVKLLAKTLQGVLVQALSQRNKCHK